MPQVTISLSPQGDLQLHLPGAFGDRIIPLRWTPTIDPATTIRQTLEALAREERAIGEAGAPTAQQLQHLQSHRTSPNEKCPFCRSAKMLAELARRDGDATPVRRVKGYESSSTLMKAEDLGL